MLSPSLSLSSPLDLNFNLHKSYYYLYCVTVICVAGKRKNVNNTSQISISFAYNFFSLPLSLFRCRTNTEKSLQNKKRVIKMLFVVVLEFFICWTPLYVINTITLFDPQIVYKTLGYTTISYFQLLAYTSSCCNPITYCFMNRGFRKACLNLFRCFRHFHETRRISIGGPYGVTQSSEVT